MTSVVLRYGFAVVSVAVALGLALLAQVYAIPNLEFPLFLTAIAVTVWYAGAGPGVLAVLFSGLGFDYFLTEPLYTLYIEPPNRPLFVVFILFALMIAWFSSRRRRIEQELRQALNELDIAAQRTQQAHLLNLTHDTAVLLLDLKLPKVDGLEVLQQIKSDEKLKMIPVVVLTSSREERDMVASYKLGVNAYVVKPVDFHEFVNAIKELGIFWAVINEPPPGSVRKNN